MDSTIPSCVYQHRHGRLTEEEAKQQGYNVKVGKFPFFANGNVNYE